MDEHENKCGCCPEGIHNGYDGLMTEDQKNYLDDLGEDGTINMYGARPYLVDAFELTKHEASKVLSEWMQFKRTQDNDTDN